MNVARENSIRQLAELYNVVIGIALSVAIYNLIDQSGNEVPLHSDRLPAFFIFLVTVIPFYHGAVRHLYYTYVECGGSKNIKNGAVLADFVLLFLEGCVFVAIALMIDNFETFLWLYAILLGLDCCWGFLAWLAFTGAESQYAEKKWALINFFTIAVSIILIAVFSGSEGDVVAGKEILAFIVLALARTVLDYWLCWDFYFPPTDAPTQAA